MLQTACHIGRKVIEVVITRPTELEMVMPASRVARKFGHGNGCGGRIARIAPGDGVQYERNIGGAARYWPDMVIGRHQWHRSVTTHASKSRLQSHYPTQG